MELSPSTDPGDMPKKGRKKRAEKKAILEMKLTVDIQKWLWTENGKAVKMKLARSEDRCDLSTTTTLPKK